MRIKKVHLFQLAIPDHFGEKGRDFVFLRLDAESTSGWGETSPLSVKLSVLLLDFKHNLIPFVLQTPFDNLEDFNALLSVMKTSPEARAALEMAVWDLFSQTQKDFASTHLPQLSPRLTEGRIFQSESEKWSEFPDVVLLRISPENLDKMRPFIAKELLNHRLVLDAQGLFSEHTAQALATFSSFRVEFLLDPFPPADWHRVTDWRSLWKMPVGALRSLEDILAMERLCQSDRPDWVVVDPWRTGGLIQAGRILKLAEECRLPAAVLAEGRWPLGRFWTRRLGANSSNVRLFLNAPAEEPPETAWPDSLKGAVSQSKIDFTRFFERLRPWVVKQEEFW